MDPSNNPGGTGETVCPADTFKAGNTCVAFASCEPGSYVLQEPTAGSDRICDLCPSGTFSTKRNSPGCSAWANCAPGTYVSTSPSSTVDRGCSACAPGTYTSGGNQSACLGSADCPAGTIAVASGTATMPGACSSCPIGAYCAGGKAEAVPCSAEQWDDDADPATECVDKTVCAPGTWLTGPGSATADRDCTPCPGGTFSTAENAASCVPWINCAVGTYVANRPTPISDRWCMDCPDGTFTTGENQSICQTIGTCSAGTFETVPATASSQPECTPCSPGQYCAGGSTPPAPCGNGTWDHDGDSSTGCLGWAMCRPGYYVADPGTATEDRTCAACPTGTFSSEINSARCVECMDYHDCAAGLSCVNGACKNLGCSGADWYFLETFSSPPSAQFWTMSGEWEFGDATSGTDPVGGGTFKDPASGHTSPTDRRIAGVVIGGNVSLTVMSAPAYLTSAPVDISLGASPVYLEFYRWLNTDGAPFMTNSVEVWDGAMWITLWSGPNNVMAEDEWSQQVYDVTAYRNPYFRVRFGYIVEDAGAFTVSSWNIDDVRIANTYTCGWTPPAP